MQAAYWKKPGMHAHHMHSTMQIWVLLVSILTLYILFLLVLANETKMIIVLSVGYVLVHGQSMERGLVDFMLVTAMSQQGKKER